MLEYNWDIVESISWYRYAFEAQKNEDEYGIKFYIRPYTQLQVRHALEQTIYDKEIKERRYDRCVCEKK